MKKFCSASAKKSGVEPPAPASTHSNKLLGVKGTARILLGTDADSERLYQAGPSLLGSSSYCVSPPTGQD